MTPFVRSTYDEHGTGCVLGQLVGHTTEEETRNRPQTLGARHDQIGPCLRCDLENCVGRFSEADDFDHSITGFDELFRAPLYEPASRLLQFGAIR